MADTEPTYNQILNRYFTDGGDAYLATLSAPTQRAWRVMRQLQARKGFDWWFDDLDTRLKNSIFNDIRKACGG